MGTWSVNHLPRAGTRSRVGQLPRSAASMQTAQQLAAHLRKEIGGTWTILPPGPVFQASGEVAAWRNNGGDIVTIRELGKS